MSVDSIVQIVKRVLPAEYGGAAGGQIDVISRSGRNLWRFNPSLRARMPLPRE